MMDYGLYAYKGYQVYLFRLPFFKYLNYLFNKHNINYDIVDTFYINILIYTCNRIM